MVQTATIYYIKLITCYLCCIVFVYLLVIFILAVIVFRVLRFLDVNVLIKLKGKLYCFRLYFIKILNLHGCQLMHEPAGAPKQSTFSQNTTALVCTTARKVIYSNNKNYVVYPIVPCTRMPRGLLLTMFHQERTL